MESLKNMYEEFGICDAIYEFGQKTEEKLKTRFDAIDKNAEYNQLKVLHAMQKNRVCAEHFSGSTGYGYNDDGRDTLEKVYADTFHTEDALVRPQITCRAADPILTILQTYFLRSGSCFLFFLTAPAGFPEYILPLH